jgi:hypothetical protein
MYEVQYYPSISGIHRGSWNTSPGMSRYYCNISETIYTPQCDLNSFNEEMTIRVKIYKMIIIC